MQDLTAIKSSCSCVQKTIKQLTLSETYYVVVVFLPFLWCIIELFVTEACLHHGINKINNSQFFFFLWILSLYMAIKVTATFYITIQTIFAHNSISHNSEFVLRFRVYMQRLFISHNSVYMSQFYLYVAIVYTSKFYFFLFMHHNCVYTSITC